MTRFQPNTKQKTVQRDILRNNTIVKNDQMAQTK
jgi:hypothetical protein